MVDMDMCSVLVYEVVRIRIDNVERMGTFPVVVTLPCSAAQSSLYYSSGTVQIAE